LQIGARRVQKIGDREETVELKRSINAHGAGDGAAGGVDTGDLVLGDEEEPCMTSGKPFMRALRFPGAGIVGVLAGLEIEDELGVDLDDARGVFGAFDAVRGSCR
jgi:hypothetical protein